MIVSVAVDATIFNIKYCPFLLFTVYIPHLKFNIIILFLLIKKYDGFIGDKVRDPTFNYRFMKYERFGYGAEIEH